MPEGRLPNFLIIGLPKAGTTSLASYLSAHPQIFMSAEKELHFFDRRKQTRDWYLEQFAGAGDARAVGEATPTYILRDSAIAGIAEEIPDAKLIVMIRNPVDRAYSHYWWNRAMRERRDFATAVRAEMAAGPSDVPLRENAGPMRYHGYTAGGRYLELIERVERSFPAAAIKPVVLEDLQADTVGTYQDVCRFLGVDDDFEPPNLGAVLNPAYRVRSMRVREWMLRLRAWKRLPFGLATTIDRLNRARLDYEKMDPSVREELLEWFAPANRPLEARLGRELEAWRR